LPVSSGQLPVPAVVRRAMAYVIYRPNPFPRVDVSRPEYGKSVS
jgi:hypothetical protein